MNFNFHLKKNLKRVGYMHGLDGGRLIYCHGVRVRRGYYDTMYLLFTILAKETY
jgi:hypothetical protein